MDKSTDAALEHLRGDLQHSRAQYVTVVRALHRKVTEFRLLDHVSLPHVAPHTLLCLCGEAFAEPLHVPGCALGCCDEQQQDQAAWLLEAAQCSPLQGESSVWQPSVWPFASSGCRGACKTAAGCRLSVGAGVFHVS